MSRRVAVTRARRPSKARRMMQGTYNSYLVALSFVVALAASYTALNLGRLVSDGKATRWRWLAAGAFALGAGIWTMHFVGMLALRLPVPVSYDMPTTVASLLAAIVAAAAALHVASRITPGLTAIGLAGALLATGITAMHYIGMHAMRVAAIMHYDPLLVGLSVAIALVAACAAMWIIFRLARHEAPGFTPLKFGAAVCMAVAICGMHYTGMAAVGFEPVDTLIAGPGSASRIWIAVIAGAASLLLLFFTQLTIFFDSRLGEERANTASEHLRAVQLAEILDDSTNEIYLLDSETLQIVKANRGALANLGYTEDELCGLTPHDVNTGLADGELEALLEPIRSGRRRDLLYQSVHRRKDGTNYPVQVSLQLTARGEPPLLVAIANDISERQALESELIQAKKMESVGQLAAGLAHEINTPTQFVGDNTHFISESFRDVLELCDRYHKVFVAAKAGNVTGELLDAVDAHIGQIDVDFLRREIPEAIGQSIDGITRIAQIVRAMKDFSSPGNSKLECIDINQAIQNTVTIASNEWKYVAEVETDLAPDLPPVYCYSQEINQVILNLIINAAHAIEDANAEAFKMGRIEIRTRLVGREIEIALSDTGCGIPGNIRDRIFEPFFTTREVGKGSGQGLAVAYRVVVELHKGKVDVVSKVGKGTTFFIRLPLATGDSDAKEVAA